MLSQTQHSWLEVEQVGSVTVARLAPAELLDDQSINTTGEHLIALVSHGYVSLLLVILAARREFLHGCKKVSPG